MLRSPPSSLLQPAAATRVSNSIILQAWEFRSFRLLRWERLGNDCLTPDVNLGGVSVFGHDCDRSINAGTSRVCQYIYELENLIALYGSSYNVSSSSIVSI